MNKKPDNQIIDTYPLSAMQQGMLFHYVSERDFGVDIEQIICSLPEDLNIQTFRSAWEQVVSRHAVLRTSFRWEKLAEPLQDVHQEVSLPYIEKDWTGLSSTDQAKELDHYLKTDRKAGFDLSKAPNMRLMVARLAEGMYKFIWTFHHILLDGRSFPMVLNDVFSIYSALCRGVGVKLPQPRSFKDHIEWLQQQDWSQSEAFWRKYLKGFTAPTNLRTIRRDINSNDQAFSKGEQEIKISPQLTTSLNAFALASGVTLNTLVQGAWALLLSRYSGEQDIVFGSTRSCRRSTISGADSIVGIFINTVPSRILVPPDQPLAAWLKELRAQEFAVRHHEHTPLFTIQNLSEIQGRKTLFDSLVMFDHAQLGTLMLLSGGAGLFGDSELKERVSYPLLLEAYGEDRLSLKIQYADAIYDDATVTRMLGHLQTLLAGMVTGAGTPIGSLPMLTEPERQQVLVEWNKTKTDYPRDRCIHQLFEAQVERTPDAVALVMASHDSRGRPAVALSYTELNQRANQLAHHLVDLDVGREVFVGVFMDRAIETIVAILAILKAGGAYVPLDPAYPRSRLAFMLKDTGAPVLLTQSLLAKDLPEYNGRVVQTDRDWESIAQKSTANLPNQTASDRLAYVIYTSGSTGNPKGVCVVHRGVVRLVKNTNYVELSEQEIFLQFAPISFDASTFEIWASLLNGGRLVVFPPGLPTLEQLGRIIRDYRITTLWLTASLFHEMVDERMEDLRGVRQLLAGGDALSAPHVHRAFETLRSTRLINGYGPTENTTFTCCHPIGPASVVQSVPIGRPIANTTVYVLDRQLQPTPVGIPGEIYTGGDGLALCYLNAPELTASKFISNPFCPDPGAKIYKVGDLVRYLPSGDIEFLGRIDQQVKIRGFRVELGEIESVLCQHPAVHEAVVLARDDSPGNKRLVAYLVCTGATPSVKELREHLKRQLPDYMVPSAFVPIERIPLTNNGKIDRKALPEPSQDRPDMGCERVAPRTETEKELCRIWAEVLGVDQISIHDDFFDLGGHSLLALRVMSQIMESFKVPIELRTIFEDRTVDRLAERIETLLWSKPQVQAKSELDQSENEEVGEV